MSIRRGGGGGGRGPQIHGEKPTEVNHKVDRDQNFENYDL